MKRSHALLPLTENDTAPLSESEDLLDDRFHFCALTAYLEHAIDRQCSPCPEATRKRAYQLYEKSLAAKNARNVPK